MSPDSGLARLHETGWCPDCEREWTGNSEAHCASCHAHFSSDRAFDRHLAPVKSAEPCHDPRGIMDRHGRRVFETIQRVHGPVWRLINRNPHYRTASGAPSSSDGHSQGFSKDGQAQTPDIDGESQMVEGTG